jgi:FecR protein
MEAFAFHRGRRRALWRAASALILLALPHTVAWAQALVGILEGRATLLRPEGQFELAEGAQLRDADIVETAAASFAQIELADGLRVALGENTRLMLTPAHAAGHGAAPRLHLLQGWMKLTPLPDKPAAGEYMTSRAMLGALSGVCVVSVDANGFALFVESGSVALTERAPGAVARPLKAGEFVTGRGSAPVQGAARPTPEFVSGLPKLFRDALPARAARFRDRPVAPRALGAVAYENVAAWLQAEEALRVPLVNSWRAHLADPAFRAAVLANLARHPEWTPLVVPPKKPKPRPAPPAFVPPPAPAAPSAAPRASGPG